MKYMLLSILIVGILFSCEKNNDTKVPVKDSDGIHSASCSYNDVMAAIDSAKNGETVILPTGRATWDQNLTFTKSIVLKGAGIDKTIIYSTITEGSTAPLKIIGVEGVPFRITGITFEGTRTDRRDEANQSYLLEIEGLCKNFRVDHCKFTHGGYYGIYLAEYTYGVIDHCEFVDPANDAIYIGGISPDDKIIGDSVWTLSEPLGTDKAVYMEDNTFYFEKVGNGGIVAMYGARYVFRYNTIECILYNDYQFPGNLDAHGNTQYGRSTYSVEIYNNTIHSDKSYSCIHMRGGRGVVFNNIITGEYRQPIWLADYNSFMYHVGYTNQDADESRTPFVARYYLENNLSVPDQINNFYFWNNTLNGVLISDGNPQSYVVSPARGLEQETIQKNRDYFDADPLKNGYTPYTYPHPLTQ